MEKDQGSGQSGMTGIAEDTGGRIIKGEGFILTVSDDKLSVYIGAENELSSEITFEDVKELLKGEGIGYGIDDGIIKEYLATRQARKEPCRIVQGKAPEPGHDARIKYHFDTSPLRIGTINESGRLDYKDRGEIVQVKEGSLIAEKIPARDGVPGIDVYGQAIPLSKSRDTKFLCGKGTEKSEDGFRIYAKIDGRPDISEDGKISVYAVLQIAGDVSLETGHVDFKGDIEVAGCIQDGFKVKGENLKANEILNAEIDISGSVIVSGGIIGANIMAGGEVSALYIHNAHVQSTGEIKVEKEVFSSILETNQKCNVMRGKISSSSVSAKKGIMAGVIGSEASSPCNLTVGIDTVGNNKVNHIIEQIAIKRKEQNKLGDLVAGLQQEIKNLDDELESIPQEEDKARLQQMSLQKTLGECQKKGDMLQAKKIEGAIKFLDLKISQVYEAMDSILARQEEIQEKINKHDQEIKRYGQGIENLKCEANDITELLKSEKGIAEVRVSGPIHALTHITGSHSSCTLTEDYQHVLIREAKIVEPEQPPEWKMSISPLK